MSEFDFWPIPTDAKTDYQHGTQKPVALPLRAIQFSSSIESTVVDPFVGSGTTIIAAQQLGRRCYAMEIDPHYCDVAITRWEKFTGEKAKRIE